MSIQNMSLNNSEIIPVKSVENLIKTDDVERKPELLTVDFSDYETICNYSNDGSRRRGILSEEMYQEIVEDPTTCFINSGKHRIPVLMDIKHGLSMGYDNLRCEEYSKELASDAKILTLPVHELNDNEKEQLSDLLSLDRSAIYFGDHNDNESTALAELLDKAGLAYAEKPLLDSRITSGDQQASLSLYSCRVEKSANSSERKRIEIRDLYSYYVESMKPQESDDGKVITKLYTGDIIDDDSAEKFWDLYNNRFDYLGENHPISMQDSKEDFLDLLRANDTLISATYVKDENSQDQLACFTYFIDNLENLYWLNQDFLMSNFSSLENDKNMETIFTPGVVSSGLGKSYSLLSMALFTKACDGTEASVNLLFENTNFSKCYIPMFVDRVMNRTCKNIKPVHDSKLEDEVFYRLWSISDERK